MSRFVLICIFVIIFSCQKNTEGPDNSENCFKYGEDVLRPLAAGNFWELQQYLYYEGEIDPGFTVTGRIVIEKMMSVEVSGESYKVGVSRTILPGNVPDDVAILWWNGPLGLYSLGMIAFDDTLIVKPRLRLKYPVEVGEQWSVPIFSYDPYESNFFVKDTSTYICVAQDELFITPIDTFNTFIFHNYYSLGDDIAGYRHKFQYYTPGIGPVGIEVYGSQDTAYFYNKRKIEDLRFRLEMTDYCLH